MKQRERKENWESEQGWVAGKSHFSQNNVRSLAVRENKGTIWGQSEKEMAKDLKSEIRKRRIVEFCLPKQRVQLRKERLAL